MPEPENISVVMPHGRTRNMPLLPLRENGLTPNCRGCKQEIRFVKTLRGSMPVSLTEEDTWEAHFAVCPYADQFKKKTNENENARPEDKPV